MGAVVCFCSYYSTGILKINVPSCAVFVLSIFQTVFFFQRYLDELSCEKEFICLPNFSPSVATTFGCRRSAENLKENIIGIFSKLFSKLGKGIM